MKAIKAIDPMQANLKGIAKVVMVKVTQALALPAMVTKAIALMQAKLAQAQIARALVTQALALPAMVTKAIDPMQANLKGIAKLAPALVTQALALPAMVTKANALMEIVKADRAGPRKINTCLG